MFISIIPKNFISPSKYSSFHNTEKTKNTYASSYYNFNKYNNYNYNIPISFKGVTEIQKINKLSHHKLENYTGCIIGGAIGDALGSPVEFLSYEQIKKLYGPDGIGDLIPGESGSAEITDDTQMTMFTADGLIKAIGTRFKSNEVPEMSIIYDSYIDWLHTQRNEYEKTKSNKGWISKIPSLYISRNPGDTCLKALSSGKMGTISMPINNSKGNGGVMRAAPAGLVYYNNPKTAFEVGARCAAITHGHPNGYLPAGVLASIISYIIKGEDIENAVDKSIKLLEKYKNHEDIKEALLKAKELAKSDMSCDKAIHEIGGGWVGEEAIAIAVYCALKTPDNFEQAVKTAVNHDGDSDSTGAITGNIMGIYLGQSAIPEKWKQRIELGNELKIISSDLYYAPLNIQNIRRRYPYNMGRIPNWYEQPQHKKDASKLRHVKFSPQDEARMKSMSARDIIEYKKYLIKNKLYNIE